MRELQATEVPRNSGVTMGVAAHFIIADKKENNNFITLEMFGTFSIGMDKKGFKAVFETFI